LLEQLRDIGIDISAGQISNILLAGHDAFHNEKDQLLPAAREVSDHLHCDDTSARHQGKAAVCTHIGNELFASFTTTDSKSRLNFSGYCARAMSNIIGAKNRWSRFGRLALARNCWRRCLVSPMAFGKTERLGREN